MPGSKILFVSFDGLIGDIAWQATREGHEVKLWIKDEEERGIAEGFAAKCDDWRKEVDWADVVVFVRNVMIPNMYYREDIGDRWSEEDSDRLHSWGYLRD